MSTARPAPTQAPNARSPRRASAATAPAETSGRRRRRAAGRGAARDEAQRVLRTRDDAEPARVAVDGARRVGGAHPVRENLHPREEGERAVVVVLDASDLEHAVRAHLDAVALRLAARAIHDRD